MKISKDMIVGDVLEKHPQLLDVFIRKGFAPLRDPVMRKMMAKTVTIEQACLKEGVNLQELLEELNKELEKSE